MMLQQERAKEALAARLALGRTGRIIEKPFDWVAEFWKVTTDARPWDVLLAEDMDTLADLIGEEQFARLLNQYHLDTGNALDEMSHAQADVIIMGWIGEVRNARGMLSLPCLPMRCQSLATVLDIRRRPPQRARMMMR